MHRKSTALLVAALAVSAVVGAYLAGGATNEASADDGRKPLKIGAVNIARVFEKYNKRIEIEKGLKARSEKLRFDVEMLNNKAEKIFAELEELDKNSGEFRSKQEQIFKIKSDIEILAEKGKNDLLKRELTDMQDIYSNIREVISKYADSNGYDLILKTDDKRVTGQSAVNQDIQMSIRIVLHNSDAMDLTQTVINILNNK